MELKVFGREIKFTLQIERGERFVGVFINLRKSFMAEFKNIYINPEGKDVGTAASISEDFTSDESVHYFKAIVREEDEDRFYGFLRKFCKEHDVVFETSDSEIENDPEKITFEYDGKTYVVKGDAYNKNLIRLPDGRILKVGSWLESCPPHPYEIEDVTDKFSIAKEI